MTNRPANKNTAKKWPRADKDWYCETPRVVEQLFHGLAEHGAMFDGDVIWDPCCGRGNVLDVARRYGHLTFGSDLVDRGANHRFAIANVLKLTQMPGPLREARVRGHQISVISNTPYSYEPDIAERVICHLLDSFPLRRAAFILPISFLNGQDRWPRGKFAGRFKPSHTAIYRERPTMPPGHMIDELGAKAFKGGMQDYCALVFTRPHRWRTETIWIPPGHFPDPPRPARAQPKEKASG